ncbi:HAMP domain-containing histidine kinase [Arsenicitalea aurantiaca]|uniref:histidine kinase n=1 Tax=Arsenicitalea aurantiaca TaxID=1783274 RepID=A0A433X2S2_9HYPH|nr:HAMP domain-containing sensor histidine kinase [Arsenicitalea aurantiaca]RUT28352.1 HAMP domain-containing histidine kinase [Arsenicitalea aurantiaca]
MLDNRTSKTRRRLPLTTTLPLTIAAGVFVLMIAVTQFGLVVLQQRNAEALEDKAIVFVDALAGFVAGRIAEGPEAVEDVLEHALAYRSALQEEAIAVRWYSAEETPPALRQTAGSDDPRLRRALDAATATPPSGLGFTLDDDDARGLLTRIYRTGGDVFAISALFDARPVIEDNQTAATGATLIDLASALLAALGAFILTRRALRPLIGFAGRLASEDEAMQRAETAGSREVQQLEEALSIRRESEKARSRILERLAQGERDAVLARLAASLAHEVRNPLAGILNGLSTLRRFGDDPVVRGQTLDIVEKGLRSIERVADLTLSTYRRRSGLAILGADDILDLRLLIAPEARRKKLTIDWQVPPEIAVRVDADAVRQILLNLLLNACHASPEGGRVGVEVALEPGEVRFSVSDTGPGLPEDIRAFLTEGGQAPQSRGLGVWMISALVDDIGGRLNVGSHRGEGTTVTVILALGADAGAEGTALMPGAAAPDRREIP